MKDEWIDKYLSRSEEEDKLHAELDRLRKEFEKTPEYVAYREACRKIYAELSERLKERINEGRKMRNVVHEHKPMTAEEKAELRENIKKREAEEFARMPQTYIEAVLAYNKVTDPALRERFRFKTYNSNIDDVPRHKNPVTTQENISDLQEILVQDVIDYLNDKGLTEVDEVSFHVDGLGDSLKERHWVASTDSSITFYGLDREGKWPLRTLIGNY